MKLRHAAALALVSFLGCSVGTSVESQKSTGWRIYGPPPVEGTVTFDKTAPLSKWVANFTQTDIYPTQDQCEYILQRWRDNAHREGFPMSPELANKSRCVSTSDPRLNSN
jgi:hypothetical protein